MTDGGPRDRSFWERIFEPEMLVALAAVLLGIGALIVSLVQVEIMREDQHASVWPRLTIARSYARGDYLSVVALNPGIGPAVVRHVSVLVDGEPRTTWAAVSEALLPGVPISTRSRSTLSGRILTAGETIETYRVEGDPVADLLRAELDRLQVTVCYCSVFDQCWTVRAFGGVPDEEPEEVSRCPARGRESFVD